MEISQISPADLLAPVKLVMGAVRSNSTIPILQNVLLTRAGNLLTVTGGDLEVEACASIEVDGDGNGAVTVEGKKLAAALSALPDDQMCRLRTDGAKVEVRGGRARYGLRSMPAEDFPRLREPGGASFAVPAAALRLVLDQVHFASGRQDVRSYLNTVHLQFGAGAVRAAASDGHRVAIASVAVDGVTDCAALLPTAAVDQILRAIPDDGTVDLVVGGEAIAIRWPTGGILSKLVTGVFLDVERVAAGAARNETIVVADRAAVLRALDRVRVVSSEKYRGVRVSVGGGLLEFSATNVAQEDAEDKVPCEVTGMAVQIGFNLTYLTDVLRAIEAQDVRIAFKGPLDSALVSFPGVDGFRYVVMPLRL